MVGGSGMQIQPNPFFSIFYLVFALIVVMILFVIIKGIAQWSNNNKQPVLTVDARIKSKRASTTHHDNMVNDNMVHSESTSYYVTFEVESGDRMEFQVSGREYGQLADDDFGKLTFQGTRYLGFVRQGQSVP